MVTTVKSSARAVEIAFIERQLRALTVCATLLADSTATGGTYSRSIEAERHNRALDSESRSAIHIEAGSSLKVERRPSNTPLARDTDDPKGALDVLHIISANALIATAAMFEKNGLGELRTPEVQFLMRTRDAAINANRFEFDSGEYLPVARFNDLIITKELRGTPLFDAASADGLLTADDVIALLSYLSKHLSRASAMVSSGDAG